MTPTVALIATDPDGPDAPGGAFVFGGISLFERAAVAAAEAGIRDVRFVGGDLPDDATLERLRDRGLSVASVAGAPLAAAPARAGVVAWTIDTIAEPATIRTLIDDARLQPGDGAIPRGAHADARVAELMLLTPEAVSGARKASSLRGIHEQLAAEGRLHAVDVGARFCRRLWRASDAARVERRYIRRLNGSEFAMTKLLRRQSVYLTQGFLRTSISPNQITIFSLAVSAIAAVSLTFPGYGPALLGAVLYYLSTLLDCCDGEVARCSFRRSAFGCWLETFGDYASTLLILAGVLAHVFVDARGPADIRAAWLAIGGTLATIVLLAYQRHRVAKSDPDAYERIFKSRLGGPGAGFAGRAVVWSLQYIKRASVAHTLLFLALVGQVRVIVHLWAFAAALAVPVSIAVHVALVGGAARTRADRGGAITGAVES